MATEIVINNLSKNFGHVQALDGVSLHLETGMFGLLGKNGAGKTTLMRIIATLLNKSDGEVKVCEYDISESKNIRQIVGYLPQDFSMYPNMKVDEALEYLGILSGMKKNDLRIQVSKLLDQVNLQNVRKMKVKALSGGMKRRLGIAQAIIHNPRVLIVDEPTAGLDPEERVRFRNLLSEIAENRTVILSTHIVEDIEKTCKKLAVLDKGKIVFCGELAEFIEGTEGLEDAFMKKIGGIDNAVS